MIGEPQHSWPNAAAAIARPHVTPSDAAAHLRLLGKFFHSLSIHGLSV
jgi:hypothetical protein